MRGLLVVNPKATTTSPRVADVIVHALSSSLDLDVTVTTHRGHATRLGEAARAEGLDIVLTLGGDGVVNEVVNGLLAEGPGSDVPLLATVPGGSANVFARSLGLPVDPVEATGTLLEWLRAGRTRTIGLGRADDRWFVANAGLGIDAEIIEAMERKRARGKAATPLRYVTTSLDAYFRTTDRRHAALSLSRPGAAADERIDGLHLAFVQNTSPWTYLGSRPVNPCPQASFDTGLDVFAIRRMHIPTALRAVTGMLSGRWTPKPGDPGLLLWHDQPEFTLESVRPIPMQVDGEATGSIRSVRFTAIASALRVVG